LARRRARLRLKRLEVTFNDFRKIAEGWIARRLRSNRSA
jgi:hypothetical protein